MFNSKCIVVVTLLLFHRMHVPFCSCLCPFILSLSLCSIVHCFFTFYGILPEINNDDDDNDDDDDTEGRQAHITAGYA